MSKESKDNIPTVLQKEDIPKVVYSLKDPVRSSLFNYGKFVDDLDFKEFTDNKELIKCACSEVDPKYIDSHHKHVITKI